MALNGSKWSIEKRIAEAMTKNTAGGMSMNSSLLLACCFRKKGGASQASGVPKFQGIRCPIKHDHILDALGVPTLGSAMIFFLAELYSHDGTKLGRIRGHVQFAKGMGQNKILDTIGLIANIN